MIINTDRLLLRPWEAADARDLYEYAKDPDIGPVAGWPAHASLEESLQAINTVLSEDETYAVCLKENGRAIGAVALKLGENTDMTDRDDECELGYWIGKPFWGKGYIPEAGAALINRAFDELGMRAVWCGYYDGNTKSKRVQEKLGFKYHHTSEDIYLTLLDETRTGHANLLKKEDWI